MHKFKYLLSILMTIFLYTGVAQATEMTSCTFLDKNGKIVNTLGPKNLFSDNDGVNTEQPITLLWIKHNSEVITNLRYSLGLLRSQEEFNDVFKETAIIDHDGLNVTLNYIDTTGDLLHFQFVQNKQPNAHGIYEGVLDAYKIKDGNRKNYTPVRAICKTTNISGMSLKSITKHMKESQFDFHMWKLREITGKPYTAEQKEFLTDLDNLIKRISAGISNRSDD